MAEESAPVEETAEVKNEGEEEVQQATEDVTSAAEPVEEVPPAAEVEEMPQEPPAEPPPTESTESPENVASKQDDDMATQVEHPMELANVSEHESLIATINEKREGHDKATNTEEPRYLDNSDILDILEDILTTTIKYVTDKSSKSDDDEEVVASAEDEEEWQSPEVEGTIESHKVGYRLKHPLVDKENYVFPVRSNAYSSPFSEMMTETPNVSFVVFPPAAKDIYYKLNSNHKFPLIGFGTYHFKELDELVQVIDWALRSGYRSFDTASAYKNEHLLGKALQMVLHKHNLTRRDIFLSSKLNPRDFDDGVQPALLQTLKNLRTKYLDLYVILWPGHPDLPPECPYNAHLRDCTWKAMIKAKNLGFVKSIGVSNYTLRHLKELVNNCHGVKPSVNQIEWHPYNFDEDMRNYCRQHRILIQGYYSLGGPEKKRLFRRNKKLKEMAKCLEVTREQWLLRWSLHKNVGLILRGRTQEQIDENINLDFDICCDCIKLIEKKCAKNPQRLGRDTSHIY